MSFGPALDSYQRELTDRVQMQVPRIISCVDTSQLHRIGLHIAYSYSSIAYIRSRCYA